jgi:hypothetical protein
MRRGLIGVAAEPEEEEGYKASIEGSEARAEGMTMNT